jgi:preprotein translocase subunit SecE
MKKFFKFLVESKEELTKVVWPTRKEAIAMTSAVLIICVIVGVYLGAIDYVLSKALTFLLKK